jgi:chromosome partitioning protein
VGLPTKNLYRELAPMSADYDWIVIDGPPRVNEIAKAAIAASDFVIIPIQPSPFDVWAAEDIVKIIGECMPIKPELVTRFLINRLFLNTTLASEITDAVASYGITPFDTVIRNRTEYAKAARTGLTALETDPSGPAAAEVRAWAAEAQKVMKSTSKPKTSKPKERMHVAS